MNISNERIHLDLRECIRHSGKISKGVIRIAFSFLLLIGSFATTFAQRTLEIASGRMDTKVPELSDRTVEYVSDGVIVSYSFKDILSFRIANEDGYFTWRLPGFSTLSEEGFPAVPNRADVFTIGNGYDVDFSIIDEEFVDYNCPMAAFGGVLADLDLNVPTSEFSQMREYNGFFPKETLSALETEYYRGRPIYRIKVSPVLYNQKTGVTRFYTKIIYKVRYTKKQDTDFENSTAVKLPTLEENSIFERIGIPLIKQNEDKTRAIVLPQTGEPGKKYLIVTRYSHLPAAQRLAEWKKCLGYNTEIIQRNPNMGVEEIKERISNIYNSEGLDYVLFLGDQTIVPAKEDSLNLNKPELKSDPFWTPKFLTDLYYVCMDGENDFLPDIHKGRIPAATLEQANIAVNKIIRYEKNPPIDPNFYKYGVNLAHLELDDKSDTTQYKESCRFVFTSENIKDYLEINYGMDIKRVYACNDTLKSGRPFRYNSRYCYDGSLSGVSQTNLAEYELMPYELQDVGFWRTGMNACGPFNTYVRTYTPSFLFYSGHGNVDRWCCPYISVERSIRQQGLFKVVKYPLMLFSITCQSGKYNIDDCFTSAWINDKVGAVGAFAATHFTWLLDQLAQVEVMINCIFPKSFINPYYGILNNPNVDNLGYYPEGMTMGQVLDESINNVPIVTNSSVSMHHRKVCHYFGDPTMKWYIKYPDVCLPNIVENDSQISFQISRGNTDIVVYDTQFDKVTVYRYAQNVTLNKQKAKYCVVSTVGNGLRPYSWWGTSVNIEALTNQSIINY